MGRTQGVDGLEKVGSHLVRGVQCRSRANPARCQSSQSADADALSQILPSFFPPNVRPDLARRSILASQLRSSHSASQVCWLPAAQSPPVFRAPPAHIATAISQRSICCMQFARQIAKDRRKSQPSRPNRSNIIVYAIVCLVAEVVIRIYTSLFLFGRRALFKRSSSARIFVFSVVILPGRALSLFDNLSSSFELWELR